MDHNEFVDLLYEVLEDPEVCRKLRRTLLKSSGAASSHGMLHLKPRENSWSTKEEEYEGKNAQLERQLATLKNDISQKENEIQRLCGELSSLENQNRMLESQKEDMEKTKEPFDGLLNCYQQYWSMASPLSTRLKEVISDHDPLSFLMQGTQLNSLRLFWQTIADARTASSEEISSLLPILRQFIDSYNLAYKAPVLALMENEMGRDFDSKRHERGPGCSVYSGKIQTVILPGIWNLNTDEAVKKSIVWYQ